MLNDWTPEQIATVASATAALIGAVAAVVSAVFAFVAIRAQRAAQRPHVRVRHSSPIPVYTPVPGSFVGSKLGEPWFLITVHNDSLQPVTIKSAALELEGDAHVPFIGPPSSLGGIGDDMPKRLQPGEEASFYLGSLREIATVHAERGRARRPMVTLAGGQEFHGPKINGKWLDGWAPKA